MEVSGQLHAQNSSSLTSSPSTFLLLNNIAAVLFASLCSTVAVSDHCVCLSDTHARTANQSPWRNPNFVSAVRKLLLAQLPVPKREEWLGFVVPFWRRLCSECLHFAFISPLRHCGVGPTPFLCGVDDPERGYHGFTQTLQANDSNKCMTASPYFFFLHSTIHNLLFRSK
jgi:hypothetical protein